MLGGVSKVLAAEYENYHMLGDVHRMTADTYAVQHPGQPARTSTRSVWTHLVALHFCLERGFDGDKSRWQMRRFLERVPELKWLPPPDFAGTLNVSHVLAAVDSRDHVKRAKEWAESVYSCWHRLQGAAIERMVHQVLG